MADLTRLPHGLGEAGVLRAIIETPRGSQSKYNYDPESGLFRLAKLLPEGMSMPLDFGFVPSTRAGDGDSLDIMVLSDEPAPVGALLDVRLIGVLRAEQDKEGRTERNDRLLAATRVSRLFSTVRDIGDLDQAFIAQLSHFWINKAELEGKRFRVLGLGDRAAAMALVRELTI